MINFGQQLAPIILFTYNRPLHTQKTLEALLNNNLANLSNIYIFSDGGKDEKSWEQVIQVRKYLESLTGFKKINLIYQKNNLGLAQSIINGVTKIVNKYGKVIVLEDDHVTAPYFLDFMNQTLHLYENQNEIWQVSGWAFPIRSENLPEVVKHKVMNCWGWGTWKNRWQYFEKNPEQLIKSYDNEAIKEFCLNGADPCLWRQVTSNYSGSINSWAIFWHEVIYRNNGYYISPTTSLLENTGIDGSGTHHGKNKFFDITLTNHQPKILKNVKEDIFFNERVELFYFRYNHELKQSHSLHFSKNLNRLYLYLKKLSKNEKYIVYGAGTGLSLILNIINKKNILFIIDKNPKSDYIEEIKVIPLENLKDVDDKLTKFIISPIGRFNEIKEELTDNFNIDEDRFISLDIFHE